MADSSWSQLYDEAASGVVAGIAAGIYGVQVDAVRVLAKSRLLFLDLKVEKGPLAGKAAQVNLYLPKPGERGAGFHFRNKILGFGDLSAVFNSMPDSDPEAALQMLADALVGRRVIAEIGLRADGDFAGQNELVKTKVADDNTAAPAAVPATPEALEAPAESQAIPEAAVAEDAEPF